jgi:hypothetical protein
MQLYARHCVMTIIALFVISLTPRITPASDCAIEELFPARLGESEICLLARQPAADRARFLSESSAISPGCKAVAALLLRIEGTPDGAAADGPSTRWAAGLFDFPIPTTDVDGATSFTLRVRESALTEKAALRAEKAVVRLAPIIEADSTRFMAGEAEMEGIWQSAIISSAYFVNSDNFTCESAEGVKVELGELNELGPNGAPKPRSTITLVDAFIGTDVIFARARAGSSGWSGMSQLMLIERRGDDWELRGFWPVVIY